MGFNGIINDLTGKKFGKLSVLYRDKSDRTGHTKWVCLCECGNIKSIYKDALLSGRQISCGCYHKEKLKKGSIYTKKYNRYDLSGKYGIGYASNTNSPFYFDIEDYEKIKDYCWREDKNGYIVSNDYSGKYKTECILIHRLICEVVDYENIDVDHIKHNLKDNRKSELRVVSHSDNLKNLKLSSKNTSGVTGVSFNKQNKKWESYITVNKKSIHLGRFIEINDAIKVRKEAEEKYFGEYSFDNSMSLQKSSD